MAATRVPTRQRIINTALELFARQGITETTTRQISEQAAINEVTLFRHFGNKHGLLLAVLQECLQKYLLLTQVGESLMISGVSSEGDLSRFLSYYIKSSVHALESVPELLRSLVGEAGQYPAASKQALAQGVVQVNQSISHALKELITQADLDLPVPPLKLAALINTCIMGYAVIALTSDAQAIWSNQDDFINTLVDLVGQNLDQVSNLNEIPEATVRKIMLNAKQQGAMPYAIAYLLFATGIKVEELVRLRRQDILVSEKARLLRIGGSDSDRLDGQNSAQSTNERVVPINNKILGHRYGSAKSSPLATYLKNRKDSQEAMFLVDEHRPIRVEDLQRFWFDWCRDLRNPDGSEIALEQTRHTWGIEMLMRGMEADNFRIISGLRPSEVKLYQNRVQEKQAINQAIALDA
ncbi:transcriptional regulator, TetR family [Thalassoporum mexicanum PCC 7367]|uniref:TetR family transcriptional regulator n=1 Tax=Thalassoporum mexicanum TaxID=3457544 RepID=UPI00029FACAF|nr:TetR family transcriptional regulator [Pseudanabaena sp. PCC 7367]AFY70479.1 transcriptional regulator, TetR family [Pseudanabaena sp. PCC 7367]